jgi:hypothetical protein
MLMQLTRKWVTARSTVGELAIDGKFECFTLEDVVRKEKIKGETAIPAGTYEIAVTFSNRFQKYMPLLINVPNFEGIRIHSGNTPADTEGCILVGETRADDFIGNSRRAFISLFKKIKDAARKEKVLIEITEKK